MSKKSKKPQPAHTDDQPADIRAQIENTITVLASTPPGDLHAATRSLSVALDTLRAARQGIRELDEQIELVTSPELDAAKEAQALREKLQKTRDRVMDLEVDVALAKEERDVEEQVHSIDRARLQELEKKAKTFDDVLMNDDEAFDRYMDQALDKDPRMGDRE